MNVTVWTAPHGTTRCDFYRGGRTSDDGAQAPRCILGLLCNDGFGKKEREKEKKLKKTRGKRRPTLRMLFRRRGMLGFDYLDFQILSDRSVQIHDYWYCCCSVDKMTHSSSNGCLVTVQILLYSGRLVPSCILKVY